jgi:hypothetical protein
MNNIVIFAEQSKKRIIFTSIFGVLFLSGIVLGYFYGSIYILNVRLETVALILKAIALPFIFISIKYLKCPSCKERAGSGWIIKECNNCGEKLK